MITVDDLSLQYSGAPLFSKVNLQFTPGNCYGIIGANGAGKSTFLKILSGQLEPSSGGVHIDPKARMSVLKQDQTMHDAYTVMDTVIMGNQRLYDCGKEKDAIYAKDEMTDEDGIRASELEEEFADLGGWEAESDASRILQGLGVSPEFHETMMSDMDPRLKVKVLLAQALFGHPDIILLDEPTNNLDLASVVWLEDFLMDYDGTVLVVSHDRYFLNNVCTHIVDIDYGGIKMYVGNYEFWYESSQLMQRVLKQQNKKNEEKIKELQEFISRFSANKSKSRQATARKKLLDKLTVEEIPASSRRYPFIGFDMDREAGKDILFVENLSKTAPDGTVLFKDITFTVNKSEKIAFVGNEMSITALFEILVGNSDPDSGSYKWGQSITYSYFPHDNSAFFNGCTLSILDWMRQYSKDQTETYLRGFLGRMLFSNDSVYKEVRVLSGGEKARCMFSRMMLFGSDMLILDRPTDHLDLESITAVNNGLSAFKGNVMFMSHDYEIVNTVADRIIELTPDRMIDKKGNYEDYVEFKKSLGEGKISLGTSYSE